MNRTNTGTNTGKKDKQSDAEYVNPVVRFIKWVLVALRVSVKAALVVILIAGCMVAGLLVGVVAACVTTTEPLTDIELTNSDLTSFLYYADGSPITYVTEDGNEEIIGLKSSGNVNRVLVDLEDIPKDLVNAFIAIEDERFYSHHGVDVKRSLGAVVSYIVPGMRDYGGSTITQQLVKNATGDDRQSIPRKIREAWRAYLLEKDFTKDEIMEKYLNIIYLGLDVCGVQAAAHAYFDKDVSELSLAECAFMAGITKNPYRYAPYTTRGRTYGYQRQVVILDQMLDQGMITRAQYTEAIQTKLTFNEEYHSNTSGAIYSYFVDAVIRDVRKALVNAGYNETQANNLIYGGGIQIMTTQDRNIQEILDREFCNPENFPGNENLTSKSDMVQASMVIIDQYTGQVKAMYGGYGEKETNLAYNYATDAKRQPGSSIKPILVYGPMVDRHVITPDTIVNDVVSYLDPAHPDVPWPNNDDLVYRGPITIRYALTISCNVIAATLYSQDKDTCLEYLKRAGIDRTDETQMAVALGGLTNGVSALDMAAAYVPFANGAGVYYKPITFTKILDRDGKVLLDNITDSRLVYEDSKTAAVMTSLLQSVVYDAGGTGHRAAFTNNAGESMPVAGKTGTASGFYDLWFCGFSGYYTAAVWYGYTQPRTVSPSYAAVQLWHNIMAKVHAELPARPLAAYSQGMAPAA